ncbi:antifungal protein ginkbilobin-like protein [Andrographis paniculata]|uniref:antifungal protein ginkbilobin-like protein n=1 Tax=Andrographis paniculata TaxID=175694 RepID=UPI0021E95606|nr:antifungal protein ginkbilobin-like protein [Andrographis paniculata]
MAPLDSTAVLRSPVLILLAGFLLHTATCKPNTAVSSVLCNSGTYTKGDPFAASLAAVLADLESVAPSRPGYDFRNISPYPNAFAYGHAACNRSLSASDCAACLAAAKTAVIGGCDARIGGRALLIDCNVRYEQYPFDD